MLKKNQIEEAEITAMSSDGNGIAKIDGMVVFVPYTAVGDKLKIRIVKVQKNYSFGIIEEILEPSRTGWMTTVRFIKNAAVVRFAIFLMKRSCATRRSLFSPICADWAD